MLKKFFIFLGLLCLISFNAYALKLYLLSEHKKTGEHNQVLGIASAFEKIAGQKVSIEDIDIKTISSAILRAKIEETLSKEKVIVIASTEAGLNDIVSFPSNPNLITCLSSHMFLEKYKDPQLLKKINYIAIPTHEISKDLNFLGTKLIQTPGVAHNRKPEDTDQAYKKWGQQELPICKSYIGVILGGDAPLHDSKNDIKFFTENDVIKLADYLATNSKDACILVQNGPRTGKYDKTRKEILTVHRKGYSDPLTELFAQILKIAGIQIKVFDFQYKTPENTEWVSPYNAFDLVVGTLRNRGGPLIVPGESTSMISEAIDTMPTGNVLIYENNAMNKVHKAHVDTELAAGRASVLKNYHDILRPNPKTSTPVVSAAEIIAQKLWRAVN